MTSQPPRRTNHPSAKIPATSSSSASTYSYEPPLYLQILPQLSTLSLPAYSPDFDDYHPLSLLLALSVFTHTLWRSSLQLHLHPNPTIHLDDGMLNRITTFCDEIRSFKRRLDHRVTALDGGTYDTILEFNTMSSKIRELLSFLKACGVLDAPRGCWAELTNFVYRAEEAGKLKLNLLGHTMITNFFEPALVAHLARLDRFVKAVVKPPEGVAMPWMSVEDGLVPADRLRRIGEHEYKLRGSGKPGTWFLIGPETDLCPLHQGKLIQTLEILSGGLGFGLLPLKGFTVLPSTEEGKVYMLFASPTKGQGIVGTLREALANPAPPVYERIKLAYKISEIFHAWDCLDWPGGAVFPEDLFIVTGSDGAMTPYFRNIRERQGCSEECPPHWPTRTLSRAKRDMHEREVESLGFLLWQIYEWKYLDGNAQPMLSRPLFSVPQENHSLTEPEVRNYAWATLNALGGKASQRWVDREADQCQIFASNRVGSRVIHPLAQAIQNEGWTIARVEVLHDDDKGLPVEYLAQDVFTILNRSSKKEGLFSSLRERPKLRPLGTTPSPSIRPPKALRPPVSEPVIETDTFVDVSRPVTPPPAEAPCPVLKCTTNLKRKIFPIHPDPYILDTWNNCLLPSLEKIIRRIPAQHKPASLCIDLFAIGEVRETAKPTIVVTCDPAAAGYVTQLCKRRFSYERDTWDFKVKKGTVRRCAGLGKKEKEKGLKTRQKVEEWIKRNNVEFQEKPVSGASIGAVRDGFPLPPGTLGGVVEVGGECFGLTVHHLLEPMSAEDLAELGVGGEGTDEEEEEVEEDEEYVRVEASPGENGDSPLSDCDEESDPNALYWESDSSSLHSFDSLSTTSDSPSTSTLSSTGDLPGFDTTPDNLTLTQPTFYDPSHGPSNPPPHLGTLHASSGLRRTRINGITHELDWALISIPSDRLTNPPNIIPGAATYSSPTAPSTNSGALTPTRILPTAALSVVDATSRITTVGNGRSTGLDVGEINAGMSALLLPGRRTMSRSWHVVGRLGEPGDSGAWVCDREGRVVGVVVAAAELGGDGGGKWAYFCPMEVVVEDLEKTLGVEVKLPGGVGVGKEVEMAKVTEKLEKLEVKGEVVRTRGRVGKPVVQMVVQEEEKKKQRFSWACTGLQGNAQSGGVNSEGGKGVACTMGKEEAVKAIKSVAKGVGDMMVVCS